MSADYDYHAPTGEQAIAGLRSVTALYEAADALSRYRTLIAIRGQSIAETDKSALREIRDTADLILERDNAGT